MVLFILPTNLYYFLKENAECKVCMRIDDEKVMIYGWLMNIE